MEQRQPTPLKQNTSYQEARGERSGRVWGRGAGTGGNLECEDGRVRGATEEGSETLLRTEPCMRCEPPASALHGCAVSDSRRRHIIHASHNAQRFMQAKDVFQHALHCASHCWLACTHPYLVHSGAGRPEGISMLCDGLCLGCCATWSLWHKTMNACGDAERHRPSRTCAFPAPKQASAFSAHVPGQFVP